MNQSIIVECVASVGIEVPDKMSSEEAGRLICESILNANKAVVERALLHREAMKNVELNFSVEENTQ